MKRFVLAVWLSAALFAATAAPGLAAAVATTTVTRMPLAVVTFTCVGGLPGEPVLLTGTVQQVRHVTIDSGTGQTRVVTETHYQVAGTALLSGAQYRAAGVTVDSITFQAPFQFPVEGTGVRQITLVGAGQVPDLVVHMTQHRTIDANGEVTAVVNTFTLQCQG